MTTEEKAQNLVAAILFASGSNIKHYSIQKTRDEMFLIAQKALVDARNDALEEARLSD